MATVIIDGIEKVQIEGVLLEHLQTAYTNCWLKRQTDNVAVRLPRYKLETGIRYILYLPQTGNFNITIQFLLF